MNGPYALALGLQAYDELDADSEDGYPLRRRVEESMPDVSLVWAPALQGGAALLSTRGGDYELTVGQDLSIGYAAHDRTDVELYPHRVVHVPRARREGRRVSQARAGCRALSPRRRAVTGRPARSLATS